MNWSLYKRKLSQTVWPSITDEPSARKAALQGGGVAAFISVATAIFAILGFLGLNMYGLVDATVFAIIAWRIIKMSQFAAVAGLVMYLSEVGYRVVEEGKINNPVLVLICCFGFINAIRGTLFYHRLLKNKK